VKDGSTKGGLFPVWNQDYSRVVEEHEKLQSIQTTHAFLKLEVMIIFNQCTNAESSKMKLHEMEFDDFTNEVLRSIRKPRQPNYDQAKKN
jgi:hypothetical protein